MSLLLLCACAGQSAAVEALPAAVQSALQAARLPKEALAVWLAPVEGGGEHRLSWRAEHLHNPASLAKLATTWSALEQLGPAWRWRTPVWIRGRHDTERGVLEGDVHIAGRGDPSLVLERVWLLLRALQQRGVNQIDGDFVLDQSAFAADTQGAAEFDGEPWRPGNVRPAALLLSFRTWSLQVIPDLPNKQARLTVDLPMGLAQDHVPIRTGPCIEPRSRLGANWRHPDFRPGAALRFDGHWPSACGEHRWPLADPQPELFEARLIAALWRQMGGKLAGRVRVGAAPLSEPPSFEWSSPPLAEVVRDINKHSNNLMAEQLGWTLALQAGVTPVDAEAARLHLATWLRQRMGWKDGEFVWINASGLSREGRLSARQLGQLLREAWHSPVMPEFIASLPLAGEDGTLSRDPQRFGAARARAHLKTGSLRDVQALAGYVQDAKGRRWVLVALLEHPNAAGGRQALDALLHWAVDG